MHLLQGRLYHSEFDQSRIADRLLVSGLSHTVPPPGFRPFRSDHPMNFAWSLGGKHPGTRQDLGLFKPKTTGESTVDHQVYHPKYQGIYHWKKRNVEKKQLYQTLIFHAQQNIYPWNMHVPGMFAVPSLSHNSYPILSRSGETCRVCHQKHLSVFRIAWILPISLVGGFNPSEKY